MAADLRVGLLGLGMMGRHHARVLRSLDGVDLVAVADPFGDKHGVANGLPLVDEVAGLISSRIDMCVVAIPTTQHLDVGLELADAGVHALIEKPLAHDAPSATVLAEAFGAAGLVGAVGHIERYNPALQAMRTRLQNRELGEIYQVVTRRQGPFPPRIADVGVVKDLATHDLDLTAWVSDSDFTSVSAHIARKSGRSHEDLVVINGLLLNGTVTSHLVNWLSPMKERVTVVTGERGAFVGDTLAADLTFYANGAPGAESWDSIANFRGVSEGDVIRYAIQKKEPLQAELEAFRDAVRGMPSSIVTMDQGRQAVIVAEAVLESARAGNTQSIEMAVSRPS